MEHRRQQVASARPVRSDGWTLSLDDDAVASARGLLRALRTDAANADDWRQTIDGVRPLTVGLWQALPVSERRRALRHLARRWEVRRHRMAPEVAAAVESLRAAGRLFAHRGRVVSIARSDARLRASIVDRGRPRDLIADGVVVCVGPSADPSHDPLLRELLDAGSAAADPLGLGLDVERDGRVRAASGDAWPSLWAMGSLRKGAEWESTAVPELRAQSLDLAKAILGRGHPETVNPTAGVTTTTVLARSIP